LSAGANGRHLHQGGLKTSGFGGVVVGLPTRLIPESKLDPIPESKFVVDVAKAILYDMLRSAENFCHFTILQSLCD
jgi:hypothetical protein